MTTATKRIKWATSKRDSDLLQKVLQRADAFFRENGKQPLPQLGMDLVACHANGCPLDLDRMLAGPDFDFIHDICGIHRHIDRTTGELGDCFVPRFAAREGGAS